MLERRRRRRRRARWSPGRARSRRRRRACSRPPRCPRSAPAAPPRWTRGRARSRPRRRPPCRARASCSVFFSAWKTSAPMRSASANDGAPTGTTMNSWKSTVLSACAPPLSTFIIGTGSTRARLAAEVAVQRQALLGGGGARGGQRDAEDRVGAEARLVRRAVELDQRAVEARLVERVEADERLGDLAVDVADRLRDALAAPGVAAVAQLDRLELAGRRAGRDRGAARARRSAARPRPRRSGCRASRGSGGRGRSRSGSRSAPRSRARPRVVARAGRRARDPANRRRRLRRGRPRPARGRGSARRRRAARAPDRP